ncbi:sugar transferase [Providencia rustigianii]|uniref:sugar transferase n=1 Tax=Providencia rustigianii TaxID=158850 RepID=UPI000F6D29F8|nr:sugar transferase [Providencia rustigianii]MTC60655.1 sugar transferase [Providencia rustigianii]VEH57131.1 Putative colanic biosynthesis UDP-glucose lipid carrier transferase [Providencia rustigianii]
MEIIYFFIKRLLDILASILGLIILSPIFLFIALWIKKDSTGPIFFRQKRVGIHGKTFFIHKFRSMKVDTERMSQLTIGDDERITRSGKFIRKYKLDELAQLIDVLYGDMSLVGPRPEVPKYMEKYPPETREIILSIKPGITDLASIAMINENDILAKYADPHQAYIDIIMPIKARYYLDYVKNKSIVLDIKIIFLTILKIFKN